MTKLIEAAEEEIADLKEDNAKMLNDICEYIKENDELRDALIFAYENGSFYPAAADKIDKIIKEAEI